ncbi:MAG: hypothetical protein ACOCUT_02460 [bacterium]
MKRLVFITLCVYSGIVLALDECIICNPKPKKVAQTFLDPLAINNLITQVDKQSEEKSFSTDFNLDRDHYQELYTIAIKFHHNPRLCRAKLRDYYKKESLWAGMNRNERLDRITNIAKEIYGKLIPGDFWERCFQANMFVQKKQLNKEIKSFLSKKFSSYKFLIFKNKDRIGNSVLKEAFLELKAFVNQRFLNELLLLHAPLVPRLTHRSRRIELPLPIKSAKLLSWEYDSITKHNFYTVDELKDFFSNKIFNVLARLIVGQYHKEFMQEMMEKYTPRGAIPYKEPAKQCAFFINKQHTSFGASSPLAISSVIENILKDSKHWEKHTALNANIIHPEIKPSAINCIIVQETRASLDPHTLNYTYCSRSRRRWLRSTAHGLGQTTFTSFDYLRRRGVMPLYRKEFDGLNPASKKDNRVIFEKMNADAPTQIEVVYRHLNYYMKRFDNIRHAVVSYDRDNQSKYIKNVNKCMTCLNSKSNTNRRCLK